jgi:hypothetical protein
MKIQTLSKTQQKRLLSLCKEFFPEYIDIFLLTLDKNPPQIVKLVKQWEDLMINNSKLKNNIPTIADYIHWYQLCVTELPKRIFDAMDEDNDSEELYYLLNDGEGWGAEEIQIEVLKSKHPVDFLWDFVKECKKNKYFKK